MNDFSRRILLLFDELDRDSLDLHAFFELAGGNRPAEQDTVLAAVNEMVARGWLLSSSSDFYTRTEAGRLAVAGPLDVTLYTRCGCHLCEEAKASIAPLLREFGARLREVDIDVDSDLRARYGEEVPVIFLGSRKVAKYRVDLAQFRQQLEQARNGLAPLSTS